MATREDDLVILILLTGLAKFNERRFKVPEEVSVSLQAFEGQSLL
jgi:hypothetical protein